MRDYSHAVGIGGHRFALYGLSAIILGILAMMMPGLTGFSIITALGLLVLAAGILRAIWAFKAESFGHGLLLFAVGSLTALCGVFLLAHPLFASGIISIVLAAYFIVDGGIEISTGFKVEPHAGRGWWFFSGIVSIFLGLIIWSQFPLSGIFAVGILLGIKLFLVGLVMLVARPASHYEGG